MGLTCGKKAFADTAGVVLRATAGGTRKKSNTSASRYASRPGFAEVRALVAVYLCLGLRGTLICTGSAAAVEQYHLQSVDAVVFRTHMLAPNCAHALSACTPVLALAPCTCTRSTPNSKERLIGCAFITSIWHHTAYFVLRSAEEASC